MNRSSPELKGTEQGIKQGITLSKNNRNNSNKMVGIMGLFSVVNQRCYLCELFTSNNKVVHTLLEVVFNLLNVRLTMQGIN
jgi:hypothetical protein